MTASRVKRETIPSLSDWAWRCDCSSHPYRSLILLAMFAPLQWPLTAQLGCYTELKAAGNQDSERKSISMLLYLKKNARVIFTSFGLPVCRHALKEG